jgi:hypothetical protein
MNADQFRARLHALGLSQVGFARAVSELSGEPLSHRTVQNWAGGQRPIPQTVGAILALMERMALQATHSPVQTGMFLGRPELPPGRPAPP